MDDADNAQVTLEEATDSALKNLRMNREKPRPCSIDGCSLDSYVMENKSVTKYCRGHWEMGDDVPRSLEADFAIKDARTRAGETPCQLPNKG